MTITVSQKKDIPVLVNLVNAAFRGESSRKGWTTEADLLDGERRTDQGSLLRLMADPSSVILKALNDQSAIIGCVYLQLQDQEMFLGMLTVDPGLQTEGTGKILMNAAEEHAAKNGCSRVYMNVISARKELIDWYIRRGYQLSGETKPFPPGNEYGTPSQPLEFVILEKKIKSAD